LGQLKSTLYARMEEVSYRSGAAVAGGVLTAAGVAIALAVVLGGDSDAVASAGLPPRDPSVVPPVLVPGSSSPPVTPRPSRTTAPATVARAYQPPSAARAAATLHAATPGPPPPRVAWSRVAWSRAPLDLRIGHRGSKHPLSGVF
jgi:hypothetical protein